MGNPGVYRMLTSGGKVVQRLHPLVKSSAFDPMQEWTRTRDFPFCCQTNLPRMVG
jgi:hypothetical protein